MSDHVSMAHGLCAVAPSEMITQEAVVSILRGGGKLFSSGNFCLLLYAKTLDRHVSLGVLWRCGVLWRPVVDRTHLAF
jgi:hypothetical protein